MAGSIAVHAELTLQVKTAGARFLGGRNKEKPPVRVAKAVDKKADPGGAGMPCNFNEGWCGRARRRQKQSNYISARMMRCNAVYLLSDVSARHLFHCLTPHSHYRPGVRGWAERSFVGVWTMGVTTGFSVLRFGTSPCHFGTITGRGLLCCGL